MPKSAHRTDLSLVQASLIDQALMLYSEAHHDYESSHVLNKLLLADQNAENDKQLNARTIQVILKVMPKMRPVIFEDVDSGMMPPIKADYNSAYDHICYLARASQAPRGINKELKYLANLNAKGQTRKALDEMYAGVVINHTDHTFNEKTKLSAYAMHALARDYGDYQPFYLPEVLEGTKATIDEDSDSPLVAQQKPRYQKLLAAKKQGLKYVVVHFEPKVTVKPISKAVFKQILKFTAQIAKEHEFNV